MRHGRKNHLHLRNSFFFYDTEITIDLNKCFYLSCLLSWSFSIAVYLVQYFFPGKSIFSPLFITETSNIQRHYIVHLFNGFTTNNTSFCFALCLFFFNFHSQHKFTRSKCEGNMLGLDTCFSWCK